MQFIRRVSPIERYYLSGDCYGTAIDTPCINQMVIEGKGHFDRELWTNAIQKASEKNPGSRLRLKGRLGLARWVADNKHLDFDFIGNVDWDGYSAEQCPFESQPLSVYSGPTTQVLFLEGKRSYVVIRTHHGTMDGRGTLSLVEDLFRCVNDLEPRGENPGFNEVDVYRKQKKKRYQALSKDHCIAPTGNPDSLHGDSVWNRFTLFGKYSAVLPKVLIALAKLCQRHGDQGARILLPVDMRKHLNERTTGNLTGGVFVNIDPKRDDVVRIKDQIQSLLAQQRETDLPALAKYIPTEVFRWLPLSTIRNASEKQLLKNLKTGRFNCNAIVSNLGKIPIDTYQGGGFSAESCFFIPPRYYSAPFFLALSSGKNRLELTLRTREALATGGRAKAAMDFVLEELAKT